MIDTYSKAVLTVIAGALVLLAIQNLVGKAGAQSSCGTQANPCYVTNHLIDGIFPMTVRIK